MNKIASLLLIVCLIFTGCDMLQDKEYKISYDLRTEPINLDPQTAYDTPSLLVIGNIFEGLLTLDQNGEVVQALAESYDVSSDGMTYTFTLLPNIKWEDKTPLTASDFVFAFRRLLDDNTNSPHAQKYYCIKNASPVHNGIMPIESLGVAAKGDNIIEFTLTSRNDNFLDLLTQSAAMPCNEEYFYKTHGKYGLEPTTVLSNGAYTLNGWRHDSYLKLGKNKQYHSIVGSSPENVTLWINTDKTVDDKPAPSAPLERLIGGKTLGSDISGSDSEHLPQKDFALSPFENATVAVAFNQSNLYLKNKNLRLAIATAFNRDSYSNILHNTHAITSTIIPHSVMIGKQSFRENTGDNIAIKHDTDKAFELYKSAVSELDASMIPALKMIVSAGNNEQNGHYISFPLQIIQKELGIFVSVEELEHSEYQKRMLSSDFDLAIVELKSLDGTAQSILNAFKTASSTNYYNYSNPSFDSLMDSVYSNSNSAMIAKSIKSAESLLVSDVALIPMYYKTDYFATSKEITGMEKNRYTGLISFKNVALS